LPQGLQPSTIAAAYTRATGRPPAQDPERRQYKAYSAWELLQALAQLSALGAAARPAPAAAPPPPRPAPQPWPVDPLADPLEAIWRRTLQALELPSTRMLLSQQARLEAFRPNRWGDLVAVVMVAPDWLPMVRSREALVISALVAAVGRPVWLVLEAGQ
jgi:DNA polymerase-3 subunit gamma/tau